MDKPPFMSYIFAKQKTLKQMILQQKQYAKTFMKNGFIHSLFAKSSIILNQNLILMDSLTQYLEEVLISEVL